MSVIHRNTKILFSFIFAGSLGMSCSKFQELIPRDKQHSEVLSSENLSGVDFRLNDHRSVPFLSASDFSAADIKSLSADDLKKIIEDDFKEKIPKAASNEELQTSLDKCVNDVFQNAKAFPSGDKVKIEIMGDFASCFNRAQEKSGQPKYVEYKVAKIHLFFDVYCKGADFGVLKGQSPFNNDSSSYTLKGCEKIESGSVLYNAKTDFEYDLFVFGKQAIRQSLAFSLQTSDGGPCPLNELGSYMESCIKLSKLVESGKVNVVLGKKQTQDSGAAQVTLKRYENMKGFNGGRDGKHTGLIKFTVNEWQGEIDFSPSGIKWKSQDKSANSVGGEFK